MLLQRRTPSHRVSYETDYEQLEQIALQAKQGDVLRGVSVRQPYYSDH